MDSRSTRRGRRSGRGWVERIEPRLLLAGELAAAYSYGEANWQSVLANLSFSPAGPITATAGAQMTVVVTNPSNFLKIGVFCSHAGVSAVVNGSAVATVPASTAPTYDFPNGNPVADAGAEVTNIGEGTFTISFEIRPEASTEDISESTNPDGSPHQFLGSFVSIVGNDVGSIYSSTLPFGINNTNHLAFLTQPEYVAPGSLFSPAIQIAVEDANNNILSTDNETPVTLLADSLETSALMGTTTVTTVNGVATFTGVGPAPVFSPPVALVADTQGIVYGPPSGEPELGGLIASSNPLRSSGGGGGAGALTGALSGKIPASTIAGQKVNLSESLTITDTGAISGRVSTQLFLATGTSVDTDSISIASASKVVKYKSHGRFALKFRVASLSASVPNGTYHLVAKITAPSGAVTSAASGGTITVALPEIDLTGAFAKKPIPGKTGKTALTLTINNLGTTTALGTLTFNIDSSPDGQLADATVIVPLSAHINIKPKKPTKITKFVNLPAGSYFLVAQLDPSNVFKDVNPANNVFAMTAPITVG